MSSHAAPPAPPAGGDPPRADTAPQPAAAPGVAGLLDAAAARWGGLPFLRDPRSGDRVDFAATRARSLGYARALHARGVRRGDRVVIVAENRVEVPLLVFAAARLGALFCILHETLAEASVRAILDQAQPRLVVLTRGTEPFAALCGAAPFVSLAELTAEAASPVGSEAEGALTAAPGEDEAVGLIYTSGSTGHPKGVVITHGNVRFAAAAIQARLRYRADDVVGLFLPFSFDYGLYQVFLAALAGAELLVGDAGLVGPGFVQALRAHEVSVLPLVPTLVSAVIPLLLRGSQPHPRLRAITSTGEHLPAAHVQRLAQVLPAARVYVMYGLTECKRVSILLPDELAARPGSVGRPLDGTHVRVVDDEGQPLPAGWVGEIRVRGPHLALGYWRDPEGTRRRFPRADDGEEGRELATGDYGWVDPAGYLYVEGRRGGVIKHRGYRIGSVEIENAARRMPGVVDAALVRPDERDELHLFLACNGDAPGAAEVVERLRGELEAYKVPEHVHFISELPRRSTGKTDGDRLRRWALAGGKP